MSARANPGPSVGDLAALFGVSAAVLAFEVLLLRLFEFSHWHHFAGLAIAIALLGLGTAGTVLALLGERARNSQDLGFAAASAFAAAGLLAVIGLHAGVAVRPFVAGWDIAELVKLLAIDFLAFLPFLGGGLAIGQAFMRWPEATTRVYAANLVGSGAGSIGASGLVAFVTLERALALVALLLALVALGLAVARGRGRGVVAIVALAAAVTAVVPPPPAVSEFKALARLKALPDAQILREEPGLAGRITLIRSDTVRSAPGLSLNWREAVAPSDAAVIGSDRVVPIPRDAAQPPRHARASLAAVTTTLRPKAEVLALGASAWPVPPGAATVTRVAPDERLLALLRERGSRHRLVADSPRRFVTVTRERFDVATLPGAYGGGDAASEEGLLTAEGLGRVLERLRGDGLVSVPLELANPPRHFPRVLATVRAALARNGAAEPGRHVAALRSLQALVVVASPEPLSAGDRRAVERFAQRWSFDRAWLPGMARSDANRHHRLETPIYFDTARAILADGPMPAPPARFVTAPATDARPYIWRSMRWREVPDLIEQMGPRALAHLDWTLVLTAVATVVVIALAALLIVAPLGRLPPGEAPLGRTSVAGYFAALGLGYMLVELALFQRAIPLLGEPVLAAALIFALFLIGSGIGSATAPTALAPRTVVRVYTPVAAGLALAGGALWWTGDTLLEPTWFARAGLLIVLVGPLTWALGRPFPWALRQLADRPRWVPWAWGVNGFASVGAASAAPLVSVEFGQSATLSAGAACYGIALAIAIFWCRSERAVAAAR